MPTVSVIIPTHNRWPRLRAALDSVLRQNGVDFEILVVDDGSTDATAQEIRNHYPTVRLIKKTNGGPASARNVGIRYASGTWMAFLDSDDIWLPGKLRAQLDFFQTNEAYKIMQTEEIWIRNGQRVNPMIKHKKFGGSIYEKCLPLCVISPSAVMIHRDLFHEVGDFDESLPACEDYDLWLRIACKYPVGLIETPYLQKFGGHLDQQSHKFPVMDRFRIKALIKILGSDSLKDEQIPATHQMLTTKAKIVIQGALKRGNIEEAEKIKTQVTEALELTAVLG